MSPPPHLRKGTAMPPLRSPSPTWFMALRHQSDLSKYVYYNYACLYVRSCFVTTKVIFPHDICSLTCHAKPIAWPCLYLSMSSTLLPLTPFLSTFLPHDWPPSCPPSSHMTDPLPVVGLPFYQEGGEQQGTRPRPSHTRAPHLCHYTLTRWGPINCHCSVETWWLVYALMGSIAEL